MTIQMMQAFWQAAKLGNFTRAAENCFMTQPAFSRLMSRFEKEMGVRLFERTTRHVTLTPEGVICLKRIDEILDAYDRMRTELEEAQSAVVTELHVGYNPVSGPPEFFVQALRQLQKAYPHVRVTIVRTYSNQLYEQVINGQIDFALVSQSYQRSDMPVQGRPLQPILLYALVENRNPLAKLETVSACELAEYPLFFMKNTAPLTRESLVMAFQAKGMTMREDGEVDDLEEMVMRVRIGNTIGISSFCDPNRSYPDIVPVRIAEYGQPDRAACRAMVWHKDCTHPCVGAMLAILDQMAKEKPSRNGIYPFD